MKKRERNYLLRKKNYQRNTKRLRIFEETLNVLKNSSIEWDKINNPIVELKLRCCIDLNKPVGICINLKKLREAV